MVLGSLGRKCALQCFLISWWKLLTALTTTMYDSEPFIRFIDFGKFKMCKSRAIYKIAHNFQMEGGFFCPRWNWREVFFSPKTDGVFSAQDGVRCLQMKSPNLHVPVEATTTTTSLMPKSNIRRSSCNLLVAMYFKSFLLYYLGRHWVSCVNKLPADILSSEKR